MLTVDLRDTITGGLELSLLPQSCQWNAKVETGGTITVTIQCRDAETKIDPAILHELTVPSGKFSVSVSDDAGVITAGVVVDSDVDDDAGTVTLSCQDLADVFWDNRLGAGVGSITSAGLAFTNKSPSGAVRVILSRAMSDGAAPAWALPVDLPADGTGTFTLDTKWYELRHMGELLDWVRDRGYSIHHEPYLTSGGLLRYSTIVAKAISGSTVPLVLGAPGSPLSGFRYRRNGQDMITGVVQAGNGEGSKMITKWAGVSTVTAPIRDRASTDNKSVKDLTWLQAAADADIEDNGAPQVGFGFKVNRTAELELSEFRPGTIVAVDIRDHFIIPDGVYKTVVTALSGDLLGIQATPELRLLEVG